MKTVFRLRASGLAWVLLILGLLGGMTPAWAVRLTTLYQAAVPVPDRSSSALKVGFEQALVQVLVKVTGNLQVATAPGLAAALQQPSQYVQQYSYQQPQAPATNPKPVMGTPSTVVSPPPLQLQVRFDPPAIKTLLQSAQLPLWGRERPLVILWVGVDAGHFHRFMVGNDAEAPHPGARQALLQEAQGRGLPVIFPLYDLKDQQRVQFADLEGGFLGPILKASARYGANAELVGVVRSSGSGQWQGQWTLAFRSRILQWTTQGADRNTVLASGLGGVADRLGALLAVTGASLSGQTGNAVDLVISGVKQIGDFTRIDHRLTHLEPIASVRLVKVAGDRLTFRIKPRGSAQDVSRNLALLDWLVASSPPPGAQATPSAPLPVNSSQTAGPAPAVSPPASSTMGGVASPVSLPANSSQAPGPAAVMPPPALIPRTVLYFRYQP